MLQNKLEETLKDFTREEIDWVISDGIHKATTWAELWAHWFSNHGKNDKEFIGERLYAITNERLSDTCLDIVHKVDKYLNEEEISLSWEETDTQTKTGILCHNEAKQQEKEREIEEGKYENCMVC